MNSHIHLSCSFLGEELSSCIWNASGPWCTTEEDLNALYMSSSAVVLSKSCTLESRTGNPSPRYADIPYGSINSMGLPNLGVDFYLDFFKQARNKPAMISVAGLSLKENIQLLNRIELSKVALLGVELNLSCPNVIGKPQVGYDLEATKQLLDGAFETLSFLPLGIKLPPYFDLIHFEQFAEIFSHYPIQFITAVNSIGNALYVDAKTESTVIKPKGGFGGLGGLYLKPTALANVRKWHELLPDIPIIGCGGIETGMDVFEHLLCGATAVQIGTRYMQEHGLVFERLAQELSSIMKEKGYDSLESFRGKLKTL